MLAIRGAVDDGRDRGRWIRAAGQNLGRDTADVGFAHVHHQGGIRVGQSGPVEIKVGVLAAMAGYIANAIGQTAMGQRYAERRRARK